MTSSFWSNQVALLLAAAYLNLAVPVFTGNGCCGEKNLESIVGNGVYWSHVREGAQLEVRPAYPWVIAITISWSLVALVMTFLRFAELPGDGKQIAAALLGFLLVGVISGFVLISVLRRTRSRLGRVLIVAGYTLAAPFGYFFGIIGPLTLEAFGEEQLPSSLDYFLLIPLTIGLYGSLPPICAVLIGLLTARIRERST
jgi:hypothetical protein